MLLSLRSALLFLLAFFPSIAFAATVTWDGGGADNKWSTAANWSGDAIPGTGSVVLFDGTGKKNSLVDSAYRYTINELRLTAANTGTVTLQRGLTLGGNLSLSGGTLVINGGNTLTVKGSWQNGGGTFTASTGSVVLAGSGTTYTVKETSAFKHLSLDDGLIGHWRFDEVSGTGTGAVDSSRNYNTGAYKNGATQSTSIPTLNFENKKSGSFDGVNDHIIVPHLVPRAPYAVTGWFQLGSLTDGQRLFSVTQYSGGGGGAFYSVVFSDYDSKKMGIDKWDGLSYVFTPHPATVAIGEWHFFAANFTTSDLSLSIDGQTSVTSTETLNTNLFETTTIGALRRAGYDPQVPFQGLLDDIRIYNRALSTNEIAQLAAGNQGTGSGKYTLRSNLTVNGDLTIYSGNLDVSSSNYNITASGSFTNNALFTPRSGTVTLNGIAATLKTYGTSLYNLTIASAKSAILRTAATVTNALTVNTSSSFTLNGNTLTATNASIANTGTITEGTGAILHQSTLTASPATTAIGNTITFTVDDGDENLDGTIRETLLFPVDGETITLTETTVSSGIFQGTIGTVHGTPTANNGIIESNDRCGLFVTGTYSDNEDGTDSRSARAEVLDSGVPCEIGGGGGGGSRAGRASQPGASTPSRVSSPSSPSSHSSATGNPRIDARIQALERRANIAHSKISTASATEHPRLQNAIRLIEFVIGRLRERS